jgi:cyanophycinase
MERLGSTHRRLPTALAAAAGALLLAATSCAGARATASGGNPVRGHLLIVGGGPIPDAIVEHFVALAGGKGRARIVIYPMASEYEDSGLELAEEFRKLGAEAERVLLTRVEADTEAEVRRLDTVTGIWFGGGDQARLTAALGKTRVEAAIEARYLAGAVVGGTSAGAAVMTTPMITGDERQPGGARPPAKDSSDAWMTIARENVVTAEGFALLPGAIVDQHFVRRRRNNRLLSLVLENPRLVGVGIDESTALEVAPDGLWTVLGDSVAVVYDARKSFITRPGAPALGAADVRLSVLPAGSTYDLPKAEARLPR